MKSDKASGDTISDDKWTTPKYVDDYMLQKIPSTYTHFVVDTYELPEKSSGSVSANHWSNIDDKIRWNFTIKDRRKLPFKIIFRLSVPKSNITFKSSNSVGTATYSLMYNVTNGATIVSFSVGDKSGSTSTNNADYDFGISTYTLFPNLISYYNYDPSDTSANVSTSYTNALGSSVNYFTFYKTQMNYALWYYWVGGNNDITSINVTMRAKIYQYYFID